MNCSHGRWFTNNDVCSKCVEEKHSSKKRSGIMEKFWNSSFDNFIVENEDQKTTVEILRNFVFNKNIIMSGSTGSGKTHLANALINRMVDCRIKGFYVSFYDLSDIKINDQVAFDRIRSCDFLVIDEYGVTDTEFKSSLLYEIIDTRYKKNKYTMVITNKSLAEFSKSIIDPLKSRLKEGYISLVCNWVDYRLKQIAKEGK